MGPTREKLEALEARLASLGVRKEDIEERFIKASGRGGQKVNKSSSAVFVRHIPTALSVKCGRERSQHLNRFLALRRLADKIEASLEGTITSEEKKAAAIRKQKARRKKRAKRNPQ